MMRLQRDRTALLVIDVQERLLPVIHTTKEVEHRIATAVTAARALGLPVLVTEQYPRGLGPTTGQVAAAIKGIAPVEKMTFSCCGSDAFSLCLSELAPQTVLVAGIETHVCVLQTCMDLAARAITPVLLGDCCGSRHPYDHQVAIERMRAGGAVITTLESALFELVGAAGTDEFRQISGLVKQL